MINKRIFRYRMFKRLAYFYFVSQGLALATAFIIELSVGSYQLYVWYVFETILELTRFCILCTIYSIFNPFFQMNHGLFLSLTLEVPNITLIHADSNYTEVIDAPTISFPPGTISIFVASPIN